MKGVSVVSHCAHASCRLPIVCGERRSANRTRWTQQTSVDTTSTRETRLREASQLSRRDGLQSRQVIRDKIWKTAKALQELFFEIDQLVDCNARRVRRACRDHKLGPHHFAGSTGYGHGDLGRHTLDKVFAQAMGAESALVRHQFVSGTHAIAAGLFGVLRPGHELICVTGSPYDTLHEVIGQSNLQRMDGSLSDWGVLYKQHELDKNGRIDLDAIRSHVRPLRDQVVYIQRSCGYAMRKTIRIEDIEEVVSWVKSCNPDCLVLVDNCYGEFTEDREPSHVGADLIMGSLIKNPGGTIVSTGGYVAGRRSLVDRVHARLTAPGIGVDAGSVSGEMLRFMFQGLCLAPQMVGESLKSGSLISRVMTEHGYTVFPLPSNETPYSFITGIELGSEKSMMQFCKAIQMLSPVGSYIEPIPGKTPGYEDAIIFADGTFIDGSTSELSADGPIRPPYAVYCQGGTHWTQWAEALENVLTELGHYENC